MKTRKEWCLAFALVTTLISTALTSVYFWDPQFLSTNFANHFAGLLRVRLAESEIYRTHFFNVSLPLVNQVLTQRLSEVQLSEPKAPYPPKSVALSKGRTVGSELVTPNNEIVRNFVNPLCIPTVSASEICFSTFEHSFFAGAGSVVQPAETTYYEIAGGCCERHWTVLVGKTVDLSTSQKSYTLLRHRAVIVLNQYHGTTYFHVINEIVTKYLYSLPLIDANPDVLVSISESGVSRKILYFLGLPSKRILSLKSSDFKNWIGAGLLIFPPSLQHFKHLNVFSDEVIFNVSAVLLGRSAELYGRGGGNLDTKPHVLLMERAIFRKTSGECKESRCLKNFDDFLHVLRHRLTLEVTVFKATADIPTAIKLFSQASVVIGVHGAGFQNIMFCKPNTTVVEMGFEPFYSGLSKRMSLRYNYLFVPGLTRESRNIVIDVDKYVNQIMEIIENNLNVV